MLSDERISQILQTENDLDKAVQQLIDEANEAGGVDNITVVLARIESVQ
jgi:protein phosphatase